MNHTIATLIAVLTEFTFGVVISHLSLGRSSYDRTLVYCMYLTHYVNILETRDFQGRFEWLKTQNQLNYTADINSGQNK